VSASHAPVRRRAAGGRLLRSRLGGFLRWLLPRLLVGISYLVFTSCRIRFVGKENEDRFIAHGKPIIFAGWHEGLLMLPYHFRGRQGVVMVSASRDGDIIADTIERFGLRAIRGSTGRGGIAALKGMIEALRHDRFSAGIIVDGPKGPPLVAKSGVLVLARATGVPIVPGTWWARPVVRFKSWDRTILPLPFAKLVFAFEEPLLVPRDTDDAALPDLCDSLTARLLAARRRAQAELGVDPAPAT
jgi:lysophospholipid acyltransferase (LPLAT)-like uncharacterized protein